MQTPVKKPQNAQKAHAAQQKPAPGKRPVQTKKTRKPEPRQAQANTRAQAQKRKRSLSAGEKRGAQMLFAILLVAVTIYLAAVLIIAFFIWYSFGTLSENTALYALRVLDSDGETRIASYSVEQANNRYGLYVPYSVLAPVCSFGVAGDSEQVTLYMPDAGGSTGSILCNRDSSLVEINGSSVRLPAPVLFEGNDFLLPVSLFETYLAGLDVAYDPETQICTLTVPATPAFSLKLHRPEPAALCTSEQFALADMNANTSSDNSDRPDTSDDAEEPEE